MTNDPRFDRTEPLTPVARDVARERADVVEPAVLDERDADYVRGVHDGRVGDTEHRDPTAWWPFALLALLVIGAALWAVFSAMGSDETKPVPAVTQTVTAPASTVTAPASTVTQNSTSALTQTTTVTAPPRTVTAPPRTVTAPPQTVTPPPVTVTAPPQTVTVTAVPAPTDG